MSFPQEGVVLLHGIYPPSSNTTEVSSMFFFQVQTAYSPETLDDIGDIDQWYDMIRCAKTFAPLCVGSLISVTTCLLPAGFL